MVTGALIGLAVGLGLGLLAGAGLGALLWGVALRRARYQRDEARRHLAAADRALDAHVRVASDRAAAAEPHVPSTRRPRAAPRAEGRAR